MANQNKTVLFFPFNTPGHINSLLGIADRLKQDYGFKTVFLILGPMIGNSVRDHGHELITLDETEPYEDYEISEDEEPSFPVDEELMKKKGKTKKQFPGALKIPQIILRHQNLFRSGTLESSIQSLVTMRRCMVGELALYHDDYKNAIDSICPDIVIVDSYFVPPCVVNLKHIPWIRLYSANPLSLVKSKLPGGLKPLPTIGFKLYDKQTRSRLRQEEPEKWQSMLDSWRDSAERLAVESDKDNPLIDFFAKYNCPPPPPGQNAHDSPHLNIYMFPEALDYDQDDDIFEYRPRWFRCDSLIRKPTSKVYSADIKHWEEKINEASKGKSAIVFFSLGTLASGDINLMKRFVNMLKHDQDRLYVISKGANGDRYELSSSNMIGGNYIPQTYCLQRANLAIVHGGNNSITECMYYGLPMIVLPFFADQRDNAQRVEDLGFGRKLDLFECTREQLQEAIDELLGNRELMEKMGSIGKGMQSNRDLEKISVILKRLIEQKHLDQSFIDECREKCANGLIKV